jgi:hypothetical protein
VRVWLHGSEGVEAGGECGITGVARDGLTKHVSMRALIGFCFPNLLSLSRWLAVVGAL